MDDDLRAELRAIHSKLDAIMAGGLHARQPEPGEPFGPGDVISAKEAAPLLRVSSDTTVTRLARGKPWARQLSPGSKWIISKSLLIASLSQDLQNSPG